MVSLSEAQMVGIISLALVLSGAVVINHIESSYYCEPEDNAKECLRISSTGITCYTTLSYDRCTGGAWQPLKNYLGKKSQGSIWYTKDPDGKTCFEYGSLRRAVSCP